MIRFDSLLVRGLAETLDARLAGRLVRALRLDVVERRAMFVCERDIIVFGLSAQAPFIACVPGRAARGDSVLPAGLRVQSVTAPLDERILVFTFTGAVEDAPRVFIELMTNRHNLLVVGADARIRSVLAPRESGRRRLTPGSDYVLPPPTGRAGTERPLPPARFQALLSDVAPADRETVMVRAVAYTSPILAKAILGSATEVAGAAPLADASARYLAIAWPATWQPCVLHLPDGPQPYPMPVPGVPATPAADLLAAFEAAQPAAPAADAEQRGGSAGAALWPAAGADAASLLADRIRRRRERVVARRDRMQAELAGALPAAAALRRQADLLLSHAHTVKKGDTAVQLDDFMGGTMRVDLDPALSAAENANRLFDAARKRERAAHRLPALIDEAERQAAELEELAVRAAHGEIAADDVALARREPARGQRQARALPYKVYRTSSGREIRVGRGARHNDALTFHHTRPDDIWMHARDVGGAHVVMRWDDRNANPPAADLREAAVLAALHSKARTSGLVAVDWTRRKYVRKPRKAPPGRVTVERTRTLFVVPDERVEHRLRPP